MNRSPLSSILDRVLLAEELELIKLPTDGTHAVVLLRSKLMPGLAFVLWDQFTTGTLSQIAFWEVGQRYRTEIYSVLCACCDSENYGVEDADDDPVKWPNPRGDAFASALIELCQQHGIHTIFMRRADSFHKHYPSAPRGVQVVEAEDHEGEYCRFYPREFVKEHLAFIEPSASRGMGSRW
jgi:hypothetical protein